MVQLTSYFPQRLSEVAGYFRNGDYHLGYRRLLDAAIETNNFTVYEQVLQFCDWYDAQSGEPDASALQEKITALLQIIENGYTPPVDKSDAVWLQAKKISKQYSSGSFSLSPLDITLHRSEIVGLVGENGNGKTTLLRVLYGELKPDTGTIDYRFLPNAASFYDIKTRMAFIPQRTQAWWGLLMDNLQYASTYAGLKGRENMLWTEMIVARMGLRPFRTFTWSQISSGYKMRFELARTLLRKPELLLLDEPLANLDMLAQQVILEDLKFLAQSKSMPLSIMLSSQQLYEVEKVSNRVIFLQKGVARYQDVRQSAEEKPLPLVIELESSAPRERLQEALSGTGLQKLSFNGGVYLLYFEEGRGMADVLTAIGHAGLPVKYLRDISVSSRRFFDA